MPRRSLRNSGWLALFSSIFWFPVAAFFIGKCIVSRSGRGYDARDRRLQIEIPLGAGLPLERSI